MTRTDVFALDGSDLNGFLFADIGVERNGMTLSVISALARTGLDPWREAGRLAKLPRAAAAAGLAGLIAALPSSLWEIADATSIATRLVALLPGPAEPPIAASKGRAFDWRWIVLTVLAVVLLSECAVRFAGSLNGSAHLPAWIVGIMSPPAR